MKCFFLAIFLSFPGLALSSEDFAVVGAGSVSCGKYLEQVEDSSSKSLHISWAQGFLSGMNIADKFSGNKLHSLPDSETIQLYLSNFCKNNPLEYPYAGAVTLFRELRSRDDATNKKQ